MAVEVQAGDYIYKTEEGYISKMTNKPRRRSLRSHMVANAGNKDHSDSSDTASSAGDALVHNYLHDLESVWWMANYTIMTTAPPEKDIGGLDVGKQRTEHRRLFPHSTGLCPYRRRIFENGSRYRQFMKEVPANQFKALAGPLDAIRADLKDHYDFFYGDMEGFRLEREFLLLYDGFRSVYNQAKATASQDVRSLHSIQIPRCSKRLRNDVDGDAESERPIKRRSISPRRTDDKENQPIS
jgi:hypothetical protein